MQYYVVKDLNLIGKIEDHVPYLFITGGWQVDNDNILMDRVMGYDGESVGCTSMLSRVEKISEEEALRIIEPH